VLKWRGCESTTSCAVSVVFCAEREPASALGGSVSLETQHRSSFASFAPSMNEKFHSFQTKTNRYFSNKNNHCYCMLIYLYIEKTHEPYLLSVQRLNYARKERERLLLGIP